MDPITVLTLANGLIDLVETLAPKITELFNKGEITAEQQTALLKRIDGIRSGELFKGPEWQV